MKFVKQTKIVQVQAHDNYNLDVKIDYPANSESVIIFCHGSGANTYDNHREIAGKEFNYFDLFVDEFCKRNIAFCRWNTRGCRISDIPPDFVSINLEEYANYRPSTSIQDIITVKDYIKELPQFKNSKILLMGISEGATLIPYAMARCNDVEGLLLLSFSYENMRYTLDWQLSGGSSMVNMCKYFDCREKGFIEKTDFALDKLDVRSSLFPDVEFEDLDIDKDGKLTQNDFALQMADYKKQVFQAIEDNDDEWLRNNYSVQITAKWCKEHFALPDIATVMRSLNVPIYIFQGEDDANIPISDLDKIRGDFKKWGKSNLHIFTFPKHDHDLNYLQYIFTDTIPKGLQSVFDTAHSFCKL